MQLKLTNILKESSETDLKYFEIANKAFEKVFSKLENGNYKISEGDADRYIIKNFHKDLTIYFEFDDYSGRNDIRKISDNYIIVIRVAGDIDFLLNDQVGYNKYKESFIHEYTHYLDAINNRFSKNSKNSNNDSDYVNSPHELNAYFSSIYKKLYDYKLLKFIVGEKEFNNRYNLENDKDLIKMVIGQSDYNIFTHLSSENMKKYLKRIYKAKEAIDNKINLIKGKKEFDNILNYLFKNIPDKLEDFGY